MRKYHAARSVKTYLTTLSWNGEYQGKKVKLNDPIRTSENPNKKFKVYVKNDQGKVVVVRFGDPNMAINRDDPERRKSFRARHNCDDPEFENKSKILELFPVANLVQKSITKEEKMKYTQTMSELTCRCS